MADLMEIGPSSRPKIGDLGLLDGVVMRCVEAREWIDTKGKPAGIWRWVPADIDSADYKAAPEIAYFDPSKIGTARWWPLPETPDAG